MNIGQISKLLSEFSLFRELDEKEILKIVEIAIVRNWNKGSHIFLQDEPIQNVFFISEGKVKIYKADLNGKEQIVAIQKKGDMFPHVGFFRKGGYPAFSEVLQDAQIVVIPISEFEKVLIENPELSIKVFKVLGEKIVDLQDRLEEQILNNTYEQIIKLLIRLGKLHGSKINNGLVVLKGEFTNKDLANMIGTTRETVSRTLTKLKKEKLIEIKDGDMLFNIDELMEVLLI